MGGCDSRVENSDSEDENVDLEGWKDIKKECLRTNTVPDCNPPKIVAKPRTTVGKV